ncbi:Hypothetical predicted protein [Marmota monax]|uniref:Uncharacterized protein n=1 Tax=Marmota monax TaxID=9995 RepID=A0A5E4CXV7_MARMO|nr:hypothetical protein GHT09_018013 [Marmota monax]VTJ86160.1 Hypothetical predicted protein [Marmota monax]
MWLRMQPWARCELGADPSSCLGAATRARRGLQDRCKAIALGPGVQALVAIVFLALNMTADRLWVTPGEREPHPHPMAPDFVPFCICTH